MSRTTGTIPDECTNLMMGAVRAGICQNKSDAIRHVPREYFEENQNPRIAAAVSRAGTSFHHTIFPVKNPAQSGDFSAEMTGQLRRYLCH